MQFDPTRRKYVVRWRQDGRQRTKRFDTPAEAEDFERRVSSPPPTATHDDDGEVQHPDLLTLTARVAQLEAQLSIQDDGDGPHDAVLTYETKGGSRYGFKFRQSDGTSSTRRGFISRRAARTAKASLEESIRRGELRVARETFEAFWTKLLAERKPYLVKGAWEAMEIAGRKRLVPCFGEKKISQIDEDLVREFMSEMAELVDAGDLKPKTVNNTRTYLSVALGEAKRRGMLHVNPCDYVKPLPVTRVEPDYLRLAEIDHYLDACSDHYRPVAEFLIGTGARISEALAVRWPDLDLDHSVVRMYLQSDGDGGTAQTKSKRFRVVAIGPGLVETLRDLRARRQEHGVADDGWVFLCPPVPRGRYAGRTEPAPPHRMTVHGWHEQALRDAGLRDMPLHCTRHTAAGAWLATGHPLVFVQRQLGHRSISTTEEHYAHLEVQFLHDAVARTEAKIREAGRLVPAA
jgi:integrase